MGDTYRTVELRVDRDWLSREPQCTLVESLIALTNATMNATGQHGITRVSVACAIGLALGILPGQHLEIHTPSGVVQLDAEHCG